MILKYTVCLVFGWLVILPNTLSAQTPLNIIPYPTQLEPQDDVFQLNSRTRIFYGFETGSKENAAYFAALVEQAYGLKLSVTAGLPRAGSGNFIVFRQTPRSTELSEEGYTLDIGNGIFYITSKTAAGQFYAIQTIHQLMPKNAAGEEPGSLYYPFPGLRIKDEPKFKWRGLLLDCCRHFMTLDFVKRYIDLLAFHKMNVLHWHLTEDQGWRIEIKKYPQLTEKGAWRKGEDGKPYGGFYTQEQIKEVVAYAASRHVTVVPEIELPGHSQAALAAYPQFSCTGGPFEVETEWGVFKEIYCAGNDSTLQFLKDVLTEVIDLFPSTYIHIGGDEAPKYRWEQCPKCQKRIKDEHLKDEHELQSWFITQIAAFLESKGRKLIGWDEILEGGLAPNATVQSWRSFEGALEAAEAGHDAIVSPTSHCYFDYDIRSTDLAEVYTFDPIPTALKPKHHQHILGGECNMWTEHAPQHLVDSKVFPRLLAMSEVLWTYPEKRDFASFYQRVQAHYHWLDEMGVTYGLEAVPVNIDGFVQGRGAKMEVKLTPGVPELQLFYTVDDKAPDERSIQYTAPFMVAEDATVKVQAYKRNRAYGGVSEQTFVLHQANGIAPKQSHAYHEWYKGGGDHALTDGKIASSDFRDGLWQGYYGTDMEALIDLGQTETISQFTTHFYQYNNAWIFLPTEVNFEISTDGTTFERVQQVPNEVDPAKRGQFIQNFSATFAPQQARFIKVTAINRKVCPDWHEAAGSPAWLFIDEIIVR